MKKLLKIFCLTLMLCFTAGGGGMVVWHAPVNTVYAMPNDNISPDISYIYGEKI